jgi:predicted O-methyltransferase YrrM
MISRLQALNVAIRHRPLLSQLIEFRQNPLSVSYWSLIEVEQALLRRAIEQSAAANGPIIEIGPLFGFTTAMMASWMGGSRKLITVDNYSWNPWGITPEVHRALSSRVLAPFVQPRRVEIVDQDSETFFSTYEGPPPALVFIDGDHSYPSVHKEIAWAKKLQVPIIGGHDYHPRAPGVIQAVDEHFSNAIIRSGTVWMWGMKSS